MNKHDIADKVFDSIGEVVRKSDFISAGLKEQDVYTLFKQGYIERVKHGYYKLSIFEFDGGYQYDLLRQ